MFETVFRLFTKVSHASRAREIDERRRTFSYVEARRLSAMKQVSLFASL
jgi:hypothetical protein